MQTMFNVGTEESEDTNTTTNSTASTTTQNAEDIKIELLNGSGDSSKLEEAKKLLEDAGYNVKRTGKSASLAQTVITNKKEVTDENLKNIKQVLGKGNISTNKSSTSTVDVTIIIGKDF